MDIKKRQLLTWTTPVIAAISLPAHATTSPCPRYSFGEAAAVVGFSNAPDTIDCSALHGATENDPVNGTASVSFIAHNTTGVDVEYSTGLGLGGVSPEGITQSLEPRIIQANMAPTRMTYTITAVDADFCDFFTWVSVAENIHGVFTPIGEGDGCFTNDGAAVIVPVPHPSLSNHSCPPA